MRPMASDDGRAADPTTLAKLLDTVPEGVLVVRPNRVIVAVNDPLCALCGHTRDELVGAEVERLVLNGEGAEQPRGISDEQLVGAVVDRVSGAALTLHAVLQRGLTDAQAERVWEAIEELDDALAAIRLAVFPR
jgi:PAS domain-containing protein